MLGQRRLGGNWLIADGSEQRVATRNTPVARARIAQVECPHLTFQITGIGTIDSSVTIEVGQYRGSQAIPVVRGEVVFFNSFVPVTDPCSVGGFGFRFAVDIITGGSPSNIISDTNDDGVIDSLDLADDGSGNTSTIAAIKQDGFLPEPVFLEDIAFTADQPTKVKKNKKLPDGRFSWQELRQ